MRRVSIDELKRELSSLIDEAAAGHDIMVTRDQRPIAWITTAEHAHVHVGSLVGRTELKPLFNGLLWDRVMDILEDDRRDTLDDMFP